MLRPIGFSALFLLGLAGAAAAQSAKTWHHGVIEPKSDAGFVMMASRRDFGNKFGLKIETLALKVARSPSRRCWRRARQREIRCRGSDRRGCGWRRPQDHRLQLAGIAARAVR